MILLSVKEVGELKGCSERYMNRLVMDGTFKTICSINNSNRKKYMIPLENLPQVGKKTDLVVTQKIKIKNRFLGSLFFC